MTATNDEVMAELKALRAMVDALLGGKPIASAGDVAGKAGDPELRWDVKNAGMATKGKRMSQLPAGVLDKIAHTLDFFAEKEEQEGKTRNGKPTAPWTRLDAARARRWALRRRMGWKPEGEVSGADSAPFDSPVTLGASTPGLGAGPALGQAPAAGVELVDDEDEDMGFDDATDGEAGWAP